MDKLRPPEIVAHADWSIRPVGRRIAIARRGNDTWTVAPPVPAGEVAGLADWLLAEAGEDGTAFLGVDFPIGLPSAYAARARIADMLAWLPQAGKGRWRDVFSPAASIAEIALTRPFYPARPGAAKRQHLVDRLGVERFADLHRICDLGDDRAAAAPLFWTLGGNQVGKGAILGWRDFIVPARRRYPGRVRIWPFEGTLAELLARPGLVVAETYPGEIYSHLGLAIGGRRLSKRRLADRAADGPRMLAFARQQQLALSDAAKAAIAAGFDADDAFDAMVGLFGMLNVLRGNRAEGTPRDPTIRTVEGWILGQQARRLND